MATDYQSPLSTSDLRTIFVGLFDDIYDAKNYLRELRKQRPCQSIEWHLAAGIHLMLLKKKRNPNTSSAQLAQIIIADTAITYFDKRANQTLTGEKDDSQEADSWRLNMINLIGDEVERLQRTTGCDLSFRKYLEATYGSKFYSELNNVQMKEFWKYLKSLKVEELSVVEVEDLLAVEGEDSIRLILRGPSESTVKS
jgi:hypothetical protein